MNETEAEQIRFALTELGKAWSICRQAGVDEHVLRTATLTAVLAHLVSEAGEDAAAAMVAELPAKIRAGDFSRDPAAPDDRRARRG